MDFETLAKRILKAPALVVISAVFFCVSFFMPAVDLGVVSVKGYSAAVRSFNWMTGGAESALGELSGYRDTPETYYDQYGMNLQELWFRSAWSLNILYIICLMIIIQNKRMSIARILSISGFFLALFGLVNTNGGSISFQTEGWGLGYWIWTASFAILFAGIFRLKSETKSSIAE